MRLEIYQADSQGEINLPTSLTDFKPDTLGGTKIFNHDQKNKWMDRTSSRPRSSTSQIDMSTPKQEVEQLMNSLIPSAKQMLAKHEEFFPYGGYMNLDGRIIHVGGQIQTTDYPRSQRVIDLLRENLKREVQSGKIIATAIIYDVRMRFSMEQNMTDAIQVCLDHKDGYSAQVFFPYAITNAKLQFGKTFAQKGDGGMF